MVVVAELMLVRVLEEQGHLGRATLVAQKIHPAMGLAEVEGPVLLVKLHHLLIMEVMVEQGQLLQLRVHP